MKRTIPQGQYVAPRFAAESFIGSRYSLGLGEDGPYSADPGDYFWAREDTVLGDLFGPVDLRTVTGRWVTTTRLLKSSVTMRDLARLVRAATSLVVAP